MWFIFFVTKRGNTDKKEQAFALFSEGKTTSSPEVKGLKLKSQSRYNYYYEWQKSKGGATPSSAPSGEAKGKDGAQSPIVIF